MTWATVAVAGITVAGKVAMDNKGGAAGPGGSVVPSMQRSGDVDSFTDHSGWVVNFGNGSNVGGAGGDGIPWLWIAAGGVALYLIKRKA